MVHLTSEATAASVSQATAGSDVALQAPVRVQRKRVKGWSMPPNTVNVTRPGKWGNPFDFRSSDCSFLALSYGCRGDRAGRQEASVVAFREWIEPASGKRTVRYERGVSFGNGKESFQIGPRFIVGPPPTVKTIREELSGKNLACFCALIDHHGNYVPCHADVLLSIANNTPMEEVIRENIRRAKGETL
jgi:Domain of unknown function (DUF4326)